MLDIRRSNSEIVELKESLDSLKRSHDVLKDDHIEMSKEVNRLKSSAEDTIPWNIRGKQ